MSNGTWHSRNLHVLSISAHVIFPSVLAGNVTELAAEMADMRAEVMGMLTDLNAKLDKIALSIMYK